VVGAAMSWNLQGYPGRANDDEGTYVDRAWAMLDMHHLSNYTFNWDHPFFGWAAIAAWAALTDGFHRDLRSVMVGRELMWVNTLVGCALLFALARRLGMRRLYAAASVVLFGLSPVDIWFHRMVSLDNLATTWALAAFVLAVSRRRSLAATLASAACFAAATWSKETIALLLIPLVWLIWRNTAPVARRRYLAAFGIVYFGLTALYPLLALLKGELLPGPRHVSLVGDAIYQLFTRTSTGSLLNPQSNTYSQVRSWIGLDPWLVFGGAAALFAGLLIRKYRPFALALLIHLLVLVKGGYVPYAFPTVMLPFAALLIAGIADSCWRPISWERGYPVSRLRRLTALSPPILARLVVLTTAIVFSAIVVPQWVASLEHQAKANGFANEDAAVAWIAHHVPAGDTVVCDAYPWLDIKLQSHATPVYLWQINTDPEVMRNQLSRGYKSIDYMLLEPQSPLAYAALPGRPVLVQALAHSVVVKRYGPLVLYRVRGRQEPEVRNTSRSRSPAVAWPERGWSSRRTGTPRSSRSRTGALRA
jgi:hypothetical protein